MMVHIYYVHILCMCVSESAWFRYLLNAIFLLLYLLSEYLVTVLCIECFIWRARRPVSVRQQNQVVNKVVFCIGIFSWDTYITLKCTHLQAWFDTFHTSFGKKLEVSFDFSLTLLQFGLSVLLTIVCTCFDSCP